MRYSKYSGRGNFFSLPNEVFLLGLSAGELAVYSFLKRCENRKTHQCWPSIRTIGRSVLRPPVGGIGVGYRAPACGEPPAGAEKPRVTACGPLCAPITGGAESPCPSRRIGAGFGALFRRCEGAPIRGICRSLTDLRGTKRKAG